MLHAAKDKVIVEIYW